MPSTFALCQSLICCDLCLCLFLFVQVKSVKGPPNRAHILLSALNDLMNSLFNNPVDANLICAVKLLKVSNLNYICSQICIESFPGSSIVQGDNDNVFLNLQLTGSVLDDTWKESGTSHMEKLIQRIETILLDANCSRCVLYMNMVLCVRLLLKAQVQGNFRFKFNQLFTLKSLKHAEEFRVKPSYMTWLKCSDMSIFLLRDVRQMLLKLVELRSSDWGRVRVAAAASNATPDNDPNYFMVSVNLSIPPICLFFLNSTMFTVSVFVCHGFVFLLSE